MQLVIPVRGVLYNVKPGDTVYNIAMRFGVAYESIIYANNLIYPYIIYPNTSLFVPSVRDIDSTVMPGYPGVTCPPNWGYPNPPCYGFPCPPQPSPAPCQPPCPPAAPLPWPSQPAPAPCPPVPPVPCPPVPPAPEPTDYFIYVVKTCDTLFKLARLFCTSVEAIAAINNIADPNRIYVGQVLRIPVSEGRLVYYTVKVGDSLYEIAARFNTTVDSIVRANNITDPSSIYPGQRLVIISDCKPDP